MADKYLEFETKSHVRGVFRNFVRKGKVPSTVSYLMYKVGKNRGLIEHLDVDASFFSCLIIINNSSRGRLHIPEVHLPELFYARDLFSWTLGFYIAYQFIHVRNPAKFCFDHVMASIVNVS